MFYLQATCALAALLSLLGPVDSNPVPLPFSHDVLGGKSIRMPFTKRLSTRSAVKRDGSLVATLSNDVYSYDITIEVGTPAQTVNLQLDTGSSDLFVLAPNSCDTNNCSCPSGGCTYFDPTQSSTAQLYGGDGSVPFNFSYGSGDVLGIYYTDNIVVGGASLTGAIIGVADEDIHEPRGILGVGLPADEVADIPEHDGVLELLVDQGYISSNSYSLYLDSYASQAGEVIFGGVDSTKYTGDLVALPIVPSPDRVARLTVSWTYLDIYINGEMVYQSSSDSSSTLNAAPATLLDSGTTLAYVPQDVFEQMTSLFSLQNDANSGVWLGACSIAQQTGTYFDFGFGGSAAGQPDVTITVLASEIMRPPPSGISDDTICQFGFQPPEGVLSILGDVFLTSAYAYYDFDSSTISLAQAYWS